MLTFSKSMYLIILEKQVNSYAVLFLAVFGTREHVDSRKYSETKIFRRLSSTAFGINSLGNT